MSRGRRSRASFAAFVLLAVTLAGCAVGPDFKAPTVPLDANFPSRAKQATSYAATTGGASQVFVQGRDIPGDWWSLFHSPALDALVKDALANNHDLMAAQRALRVAQENVKAQQGYFYPTAIAGFDGTGNKTSAALSPATFNNSLYYGLYTAQVNVSYTPDVWGLNQRTVESLQAQADSQRFQLEATYLTLTSNVVAAAIQEASLRGQIDATRKSIEIETKLTDLLRREKTIGQLAEADVALQEAALAQAQSALPALEKQLSQQRDLLAALAGHYPNEESAGRFDLSGLTLPRALPVSLPASLIEQRPDVRTAEENLRSANAQVGVAIANRLPNITLTANPGSTALQLDKLFAPGNGFYSIGGALAQPVFDGGTLMHKQRSSEEALAQAAEQYKSTVVQAFQNVADALHAIQHDTDQLKTALAAERAAAKSLQIARGQLENGAASRSNLLIAEQTYELALVNLVQAQAARYADTAALFQALGGGWWNRSDVQSASSRTQYGVLKAVDNNLPQLVP